MSRRQDPPTLNGLNAVNHVNVGLLEWIQLAAIYSMLGTAVLAIPVLSSTTTIQTTTTTMAITTLTETTLTFSPSITVTTQTTTTQPTTTVREMSSSSETPTETDTPHTTRIVSITTPGKPATVTGKTQWSLPTNPSDTPPPPPPPPPPPTHIHTGGQLCSCAHGGKPFQLRRQLYTDLGRTSIAQMCVTEILHLQISLG